jgi:hypothetical protein
MGGTFGLLIGAPTIGANDYLVHVVTEGVAFFHCHAERFTHVGVRFNLFDGTGGRSEIIIKLAIVSTLTHFMGGLPSALLNKTVAALRDTFKTLPDTLNK